MRTRGLLRWTIPLLGLILATPLARAESGGAVTSAASSGIEPRGRLSARYSGIYDETHTTHLLTGDVDVFLPRIRGSGFSLLFDGEFRKDLSPEPSRSAQEQLYDQQVVNPTNDKQEYLGRSERTIGHLRSGTIGDYIRNAYLEYAGIAGLGTVQLGRLMLTDTGQTWVDGGVLKVGRDDSWQVGAFGGLAPNPMDYSFNADNMTFGGFGGYANRQLLVRLAFNQSQAEGELDRRFLFSYGHLGLFDRLFLSYSVTLDLAGQRKTLVPGSEMAEEPRFTTTDLGPWLSMGYVNALWWVVQEREYAVSFSLTGNAFSNVPFRKTQPAYWPTDLDRDVLRAMLTPKDKNDPSKGNSFDLNNLPSWIQRLYLGDATAFPMYYGVRGGPSLRFLGSNYLYMTLDFRSRELDGEQAWFISTGIRAEELLGTGIGGRLNYTARNSFLSGSSQIDLSLFSKLFDRVDLELYGSLMDGRSMANTFGRDLLLQLREAGLNPRTAPEETDVRIDQRQRVWLAGASLDIDITRRLYLLLDYELTIEELMAEDEEGDDLLIHGLNARLTWRL